MLVLYHMPHASEGMDKGLYCTYSPHPTPHNPGESIEHLAFADKNDKLWGPTFHIFIYPPAFENQKELVEFIPAQAEL